MGILSVTVSIFFCLPVYYSERICCSSQTKNFTVCTNLLKLGNTSENWQKMVVMGQRNKPDMYMTRNMKSDSIELEFFPCEPWNSCIGRCNENPGNFSNYPPYTCYCDSACGLYSDCCSDYSHCNTKLKDPPLVIPNRKLHFSCVDLGADKYGILLVDRCAANWTDLEIIEKCIQSSPIVPMVDHDGIVYRNRHCALCNGIKYKTLGKRLVRRCLHHIGRCSAEFLDHTKLIDKCGSYSGMVMHDVGNGKWFKYKNAHCALCNKIRPDNLTCPRWEWQMGKQLGTRPATAIETQLLDVKKITLEPIVVGVTSSQTPEIAPSVSILLNFGINGKKSMYFSNIPAASRHQNCPGNHIWDPFLELCRGLSCSAYFSLMNYKCVQNDDSWTSAEGGILGDLVMGLNPNKVGIGMNFQAKTFYSDENTLTSILLQELPSTLASTLGITKARISNLRLNLTDQIPIIDFSGKIKEKSQVELVTALLMDNLTLQDCHILDPSFRTYNVDVKFFLTEPIESRPQLMEPSVDRIMSVLISNVNLNTMFLKMNNLTLRVTGVHEEMLVEDNKQFDKWCQDGQRRQYVNNEFTILNNSIVPDNWKMSITINNTGQVYEKGEYYANFFVSGSEGGVGSLANVSGIVVVCENRSQIFNDCMRIELKEEEYKFIGNRSINYIGSLPLGSVLNFGEYEIRLDGKLYVCYSNNFFNGFFLPFDPIQAYLSFYLTLISLCAMAITLVTYLLFQELRNLPGTNLMNLVFTVLVSQLTFLIGMRGSVKGFACKFVAVMIHYEILASFFWKNVMAYDLFKTFGTNSGLPFIRGKKKYLKLYLAYAYMCPAVIVICTVTLDVCRCTGGFWIGYGDNLCWIFNPVATAIFFAAPITLICAVNFILYVITVSNIVKVTRMTRFATKKLGKNDVTLYIRMSTVMGFTWIFGFAASVVNPVSVVSCVLTYLFICFHSLQGLFICWAFVCNGRVLNLYRAFFNNYTKWIRKWVKCKWSLFHISKPISRSTSVDTSQTFCE